MHYWFTPPAYTLKNVNAGPLLSRFQTGYAYSIVKRGSSYEQLISPSIELFSDPAVDVIYLGGHRYEVDAVEASLLDAAGFGSFLTPYAGGFSDSFVDVFGD